MKSNRKPLIVFSVLAAFCVLVFVGVLINGQAGLIASARDLDKFQSPTAIVSGKITHNGSPVAGVNVELRWSDGDQIITTLGDGVYQVSGVPISSWLNIYVQPPVAMGLEFRGWQTNMVSGDLQKDFDLVSGYRLEGEFRLPDGSVYDANDLVIHPLAKRELTGEILPSPISNFGKMDMVLAPGSYAIYKVWNSQTRFFMPPTIYDLRSTAVISEVITLIDRPVPHPAKPPVAEYISISDPDIDGYVTVTGVPGALPPYVAVMVINQSASNVAMTASDITGAFSVDMYAPHGSWLLVKYDPHGETLYNLWTNRTLDPNKEGGFAGSEALQDLPGVTIYAGPTPPGGDGWSDFAAVGRQGWWSSWAITGTMGTTSSEDLNVMPGDTITVSVQAAAFSPAMECTGTPTYTIHGGVNLVQLFAVNGSATSWGIWFDSRLFTPTGLPIEHESVSPYENLGSYAFSNHTCVSPHTLGAQANFTVTLPADLPEGIYSLALHVLPNLPDDTHMPSIPIWYHEDTLAFLPPIRVGDAAPPRIPWYLLMNHPIDGYRGIRAVQDQDSFAFPNRVRFEPHSLVLPRLNERTGEPIPYRLEPGSYWVSGNERRAPNPPHLPLHLPSGEMTVVIHKPDESEDVLGPAPFVQTDIRTPSLADGGELDESTGYMCDVYHLTNLEDAFVYTFKQDGPHSITIDGVVYDIYGNPYTIHADYEVLVARILDLDPAQLPTMPYRQGDAFAPGLHVFPPVPANIDITLSHLPNSDPGLEISYTITGQANSFGYFQPSADTELRLDTPGEFRVDMIATYEEPDGGLWAGVATWGGVVEGLNPKIRAHGRRGLDFIGDSLDDTPTWFITAQLPPDKLGVEHWVPYFSGDIAWGAEAAAEIIEDTSLESIVTIHDQTGIAEDMYDLIRLYYERCTDPMAHPPVDSTLTGLEKRINVGEAPLCIATYDGSDAEVHPDKIEYWGYWYSTSQRPDVHVREIIGQDGIATAYWRFNDTYGYQIGEPADGDQEGDIKWNFGGAVMRVISDTNPVNEYAIYGSFWVLLPLDDPVGPRVTPPFQDATGASVNGGPILELLGEEIDMLFLPKGVRPGDLLELGDVVAFSGHIGPPLNSRVDVTITSPSGVNYARSWNANKIGWLYDPSFDFVVTETGRWIVDVFVEHDQPYIGNGVTPTSHNTGTVLGTQGQYDFYVVGPDAPKLYISTPQSGFINWPNFEIEPIMIQGIAPMGTTAIFYTIHDKGIVMGQGNILPDIDGSFTLIYDAETLHDDFPMLSLTAREGRWEGLADEVTISMLAVGSDTPHAAQVTLIGEQVFVQSGTLPDRVNIIFLPTTVK